MRCHVLTAVLSLTALSAAVLAAEQPGSGEASERINYSLGYQIGADFKRQGVELNADALLRGLNDAGAGSAPALSEEEMGAILRDLKARITADLRETARERHERKQREARGKRETGRTFMLQNAERAGVKTLPSGLQYKIIRKGSGRKPGAHDTVSVHYRGTLVDGHEFDSSYRRNAPSSFRVDNVIAGWTEALQMMSEGAEWEVFIPPELGYGKRGPLADQTLIFKIELLAVVNDTQPLEGQPASR
jgi:FKBP-type peptidyl-prolyl cis-trans isomerase FklB